MNKKVTYKNRYGDNIIFEQVSSKKIKMSGYSGYYRVSWPNNYEIAYFTYLEDQQGVIDDPLYPEEFVQKLFCIDWHEPNKNPLHKYLKLVISDKNKIDMFDPSGGPYLTIGSNLGLYWGDGTDRIIERIELKKSHTELTIK
jgi:hypothetical protein